VGTPVVCAEVDAAPESAPAITKANQPPATTVRRISGSSLPLTLAHAVPAVNAGVFLSAHVFIETCETAGLVGAG
jgi:hypothetical protein